jgi:hypothetical protein
MIESIVKIIEKYNYTDNYTDAEYKKDIQDIYDLSKSLKYSDILFYINNSGSKRYYFDFIKNIVYNYFYNKIENENFVRNSFFTFQDIKNYNNYYRSSDTISVSYPDIPYLILFVACIIKLKNNDNLHSNIIIENIIINNIKCSIYYSLHLYKKEWEYLTEILFDSNVYSHEGFSLKCIISEYLAKYVNYNDTKKIIKNYNIYDLSEFFIIKNKRNLKLESRIYKEYFKNYSKRIDTSTAGYLKKYNLGTNTLYESYRIIKNINVTKKLNTVCLF